MGELMDDLSRLSSAEEFLAYFGVDYDPRVVSVSRLHILKRFSQYLAAAPGWPDLPGADARDVCRELLARAYREFEISSGVEQGLFKVFEQARGVQKVPVSRITRARPTRA
jgi:nitrogenase-stabilizing/protective protein